MTLREQIAEAQSAAKSIPENIQRIMTNATTALFESGIVDAVPGVGDILPDFQLTDQNGEQQSLTGLLVEGKAVVTFYRGGWCPYCNLQLRAYQAVLGEIDAAGATLVAITPELPDASLSTAEKNALGFHVLSDPGSTYLRQLGLVFSLPDDLRAIYAGAGLDLEAHNGAGQFDLPLAATYIVATNGEIVSAFVDADYTKRQEPAEILEVLRSLT